MDIARPHTVKGGGIALRSTDASEILIDADVELLGGKLGVNDNDQSLCVALQRDPEFGAHAIWTGNNTPGVVGTEDKCYKNEKSRVSPMIPAPAQCPFCDVLRHILIARRSM